MVGYRHPEYAESLSEFGTPRELPRCGGWILERPLPGLPDRDAMGCYPLFCCQDWSQLHADLEEIGSQIVSLSLVTDPFGEYNAAYLQRCFKDLVRPFKEHFIIDLSQPIDTFVSRHHRRYARKAFREVQVERCQYPAQFSDEWMNLYDNLIRRHDIRGIPAFSQMAFSKQLKIPGLVMLRAVHKDTTVGMALWYIQKEVGYYHLAAYSETGYQFRASFALFWYAIEYFANRIRWLNLGAGAGVKGSDIDGLSQFKSGWSTGTRTTYFCGRIFDHARYSEVINAKEIKATGYFPAYRTGEFA